MSHLNELEAIFVINWHHNYGGYSVINLTEYCTGCCAWVVLEHLDQAEQEAYVF